MRESFFESASEMNLRSFGRNTKDRFAEAEDAVSSSFEGMGGGIVGGASDNHLDGMMGEKRGSETVCGGEEAVLRCDAGEGLESFLGEGAVTIVACEGVHSNQGDGGDGIGAGHRGILERLTAHIKTTPGRGVTRAVKE